jgi:hypothetical protein
MLKDLNGIDEIVDFFKQKIIDDARIHLIRIYNMALRWQQKEEEEDKIKALFDKKDVFGTKNPVRNITIISEDMAIVETKEKKQETYFYVVVNGKRHFECTKNYDYALIMALSVKYGEERCAPKMIYNMLNMYKFELMDELK